MPFIAWLDVDRANRMPCAPEIGDEMRRRIERYRRFAPDPRSDYAIGCILLQGPFFFDDQDWIPAPADFHKNIVQGKTYDLTAGVGRELWEDVLLRLRRQGHADIEREWAEPPMFREGVSARQRWGKECFASSSPTSTSVVAR